MEDEFNELGLNYTTPDSRMNDYGDKEINEAHIDNMIQRYKRLSLGSSDPDNVKKYEEHLSYWEGRKDELEEYKTVDNYTENDIIISERQRGIEKRVEAVIEKNLSSGRRKSPFIVIEENEIVFIKKEITAIGAKIEDFVFNSDKVRGTCFLASDGKIYLKGNIFPDEYSEHPRDKMSVRAVLAHEYYGHKPYREQYLKEDNDFTESSIEKVKARAWADEFRASYMAAKNTPNLSGEERKMLVMDALTRAEEAGVKIKYNNYIRRILYG